MSIPKIYVEHTEFKNLGTGIIINETVKDTIIQDEEGNQKIQEVARLSVIWENVKNPAINYHGADELEFKAFFDDVNDDSYPIEQIIEFIEGLETDSEVLRVPYLLNALRLEFSDSDEDEDEDEAEILDYQDEVND